MNTLTRHFPRAAAVAFVAIVPQLCAQDAPAPKDWKTSLGLNLGLTGGNSETFNVGVSAPTAVERDARRYDDLGRPPASW